MKGRKSSIVYKEHYSEDEFCDKIKSIFKKLGEKVVCQVFALYYLLNCDRVTITRSLGYLIFPIDVILGVGYTEI